MVRSTAISWKISLAVAALALPLGQLRALADDELPVKRETPPQSVEPKAVRVILMPPASDVVFASHRPALLEEAPIIMVQPAGKRAPAQPLSEPAEIDEAAAVVESPPAPEQPPRVALLPPLSDAAIASSPPEPEKPQKSATSVVIPALPGRSPFRQAPFKSEIVENGPKDAAAFQQQASEPAPANGNAAVRFLAKLWPGDKEASTPGASTAERSSSAGAGEAASLAPPTASTSTSIKQAEADPKSEKPPIARFLDGIQFWKN